jgi:hypothetical protein
MRGDGEPHIVEYAAKTNAICDFRQSPAAPKQGPWAPAAAIAAVE